ncbi:AraC family transcriptional regulator [Paenibacillus sp. YPG26]|uniref:AraC family transcriptional regulator n=1 Tax=Paenibacillus sp. YPG26 TaxID=2878915 RepID=UPI00203D8FEC|nr:AraC family transcriptional regulator [Paenibacillus sp. YPG26]USB33069.1 AraC family transcriptional regulator [Paenibacillus sp. YPG26]
MDWLNRMNHAIEMMENRMEEPFDIGEAAKAAYSSPFHFQRMFHMLTSMTVAEYMRKRRLTLAAQELASSGSKVLDIALRFGYESPESFSKAFRKLHGVSPSEARNPGVTLKAFPRISFHLSLKGDQGMDYRIVEQEEYEVAGKLIQVTTRDGENHRDIPKFWEVCNTDGTSDRLFSIAEDKALRGICLDMQQEQELFNYMIGARVSPGTPLEEGFTVRTIPASTWAVFTSVGPMPGAIEDVWIRVFQDWFPSTGYEHAAGPEIELYPMGDVSSDSYQCEVWIPVIKK